MLNDFYRDVTSHIVGVLDAIKKIDYVNQIVDHPRHHPSIHFIKEKIEMMATVRFDSLSNDNIWMEVVTGVYSLRESHNF